jgi:hypothetical protein
MDSVEKSAWLVDKSFWIAERRRCLLDTSALRQISTQLLFYLTAGIAEPASREDRQDRVFQWSAAN